MKLKIFLISAAALTMALSSCDKKQNVTNDLAAQDASHDELVQALDDRDSLITLMGEISAGIEEIKTVENMIQLDNGESPARKQQMIQDLKVIQQALLDKRARLEELEKKLSQSKVYSTKLEGTITQLRQQIEEQDKTIASLNADLGQARQQIGQLNQNVDSLSTTVATVTDERNAAQQEAVQTANELNTCYYVVADNKALKEHKIVQSGFLRKTKIMRGDFDQAFFTTADKRNLSEIKTGSKKAQIMTNQPAESYRIEDVAGQKVIKITDPNRFWSLTNYLVVKID